MDKFSRDTNTRPPYLLPKKPVYMEQHEEVTVRTRHGTMDWFQTEKVVHKGCILSPCLFNLYSEYIMGNVGLDETQAAIKISRRDINNLRYAVDSTLMAESKGELKSLLI